jgi:pimeloyl-ACP methyl ester carboxylesterase
MVSLAYDHAGRGGKPLLLLHGWPETRRIWERNVEPLADAGFEVIAPDLRGFGDSPLAPDGRYDVAAHSADVAALVAGLGHERIVVCAGHLGGVVAQLCLFNTIAPLLDDGPPSIPRGTRMAADYFIRQSKDADGLAEELDTAEKRRRYVAAFYGSRFWAAPGSSPARTWTG